MPLSAQTCKATIYFKQLFTLNSFLLIKLVFLVVSVTYDGNLNFLQNVNFIDHRTYNYLIGNFSISFNLKRSLARTKVKYQRPVSEPMTLHDVTS